MNLKLLLATAATAYSISVCAQSPKYIFLYIGDGMGMGPAVATEMYNRQVLGNDTPITMMQFPVASQCLTYSYSSPVTDSAAAGTALSTGTKTKNGMLGMNPDTVAVTSIARILKDDGYGVAILTSVAPDDATPGAFYAHVPNRGKYYEIGVQAAESGYDFIGGAALRGEKVKEEPTDLLEVMAQNGVEVVRGADEFANATSDRIMMLGTHRPHDNSISFTIDSVAGALTLPILTQSALDHMMKVAPDSFFMMVEGGNIDHALHANDGSTAIKETLNFNEALALAYDFYKQHPDETLIVVTADHDTGGMTIGNPFTGYWANLGYIDYQKVSKEEFERFCQRKLKSRTTFTWDDMKEYLTDNFGFWNQVPLNEAQTELLKEKFDDVFLEGDDETQKTLYANFNSFVSNVLKVFNDVAGIGFVATSHTGNPVPVYAVGVGAERFSGLNNNIDIPSVILEIAGK